jgi:hypothetical protein
MEKINNWADNIPDSYVQKMIRLEFQKKKWQLNIIVINTFQNFRLYDQLIDHTIKIVKHYLIWQKPEKLRRYNNYGIVWTTTESRVNSRHTKESKPALEPTQPPPMQ